MYKIIIKYNEPIGDFKAVERTEIITCIDYWKSEGTNLIYCKVDRFNMKTISRSEIVEIYKMIDSNMPVEYVEDEHDETKDYEPSFWCRNRRYYLQDFTRTHNNPWVADNFPEFIHGIESEQCFKPLMIQLDEAGDTVTAWECIY